MTDPIRAHMGRAISGYVPDDSLRVSQTRHAASSGIGSFDQTVTAFDTDRDGKPDVFVTRAHRSDRYPGEADTYSVRLEKAGEETLLWGNERGVVDWVQFERANGEFINARDNSGDGQVDWIYEGQRPKVRDPRTVSDATSVLGVDPAKLTMPHAVLPPEAVTVAWHEDIEKADVSVRIPFSSFVPPLTEAQLAGIQNAEPVSDWRGEAQTFSVEGEALVLSVRGTQGAAWLGSAPTVQMTRFDGSTFPVALHAQKVLVDTRIPDESAVRRNLSEYQKMEGLLDGQLDVVTSRLRLPEQSLPEYKRLTELTAELASIEGELDALRPTLRTTLEADAATRAQALATAAASNAEPTLLDAFQKAKSLDQSGAAAQAVTDFLDGRGALDAVLAMAEPMLHPGQTEFASRAERAYVLESYDIPTAEEDYTRERAVLVKRMTEHKLSLERQLAGVRASLDENAVRLTGLPDEPPYPSSTHHEPYTF